MSFGDQGRILYVSMADVTRPNGPGVNEREFLLSLYQRFGQRMHAILPRPHRNCDELDPARTTLYRNPHRWNPIGFLRQQLELYWLIRRITRRGSFDLLVVRLSLLPLALYRLRRGPLPYAVKTLGEVQGFTQNKGLKGLAAKLLGPLNAALFRPLIRDALAIDCCTETHYREHLRDYRLAEDRLLVVENATNVQRFVPGSPAASKAALGLSEFAPVLGYVGGSPVERGGLQMLEIAARLLPVFPRLGVVIVGQDTAGQLKRRAEELKLSDRTLIPGLVPYESIPTYINCFDIGFALDRPARWELIGNSYQKVRQYLACGKPVVTCIDPASELARKGLVEPVSADDLGDLEQTVRRLLGQAADARQERAERARLHAVQHLSTQASLDRRLGFWERCLAVSPGAGCAAATKRAA